MICVCLAVDNDHDCRKVYSESFGAWAVGPFDFVCDQDPLPSKIFVESDVQHHGWLHLLGAESIEWGLISRCAL